jgi:hypothetical protein
MSIKYAKRPSGRLNQQKKVMKNYTFKIGSNVLELMAPSFEAAYHCAENMKAQYNWKGKIVLINK